MNHGGVVRTDPATPTPGLLIIQFKKSLNIYFNFFLYTQNIKALTFLRIFTRGAKGPYIILHLNSNLWMS